MAMSLREQVDQAVETGSAIRKVHEFVRSMKPGQRVEVLPMTGEEKDALELFLRSHTAGSRGTLANLAKRLS